MNAISQRTRQARTVGRACKRILGSTVLVVAMIAAGKTDAQLTYDVTDLGTLGGANASASTPSGQSSAIPLAHIVVGSSNVNDGSEHAFIWIDGQMYDLNLLCDLSKSDFKVLTGARTIDDCLNIIGEGVATDGSKHTFLLTPAPVDGGRWCYTCCQWVWKQDNGGWWWESNSHSYQWHGGSGSHGNCPDHSPHCWSWPLPCPEGCGCDHECLPPDWCYCCINGVIYVRPAADCQARGGQCYSCPQDAIKQCQPCHWCCVNGKVFRSNAEDCRKKGGQCFGTEEEAIRNCKACWWCCLDGKISQTTWADCVTKGGQCYATEDEAKAHQKECTPCWVCLNGKPVQTTPEDAKTKDLQCYPTREEAAAQCKLCWCCFQGREGRELAQIPEDECKQRGGVCYNTAEEARRHDCKVKLCWVCIDGKVVQLPETEASAKKLRCYPSEAAAKNSKDCAPSPGWCCADLPAGPGVVPSSQEDCQKKGGKWYATQQEALAACRITPPPLCWVCLDRNVVQLSMADAQQRQLQCYGSKEDAQKACGGGETPPPLCWVCLDRNVTQMSVSDAKTRKLQYFNSKDEAQRSCGEGGPGWWCCIDGRVVQVSEAEARKRGNQCYRSEQEARTHCQPKTVWCCMDGQVVQITEEECRARNGHAYRTEQEARRSCKPKTCWTCLDGRVAQLPESEVKSRGLQCFGSRGDAARSCRSNDAGAECWVCINGRVTQVTEAQARARGLQCFGSREEAARNCSRGEGPNRSTPRPARGR